MDCSQAKCYSHEWDSYAWPQGYIPHALTNWANSPPPTWIDIDMQCLYQRESRNRKLIFVKCWWPADMTCKHRFALNQYSSMLKLILSKSGLIDYFHCWPAWHIWFKLVFCSGFTPQCALHYSLLTPIHTRSTPTTLSNNRSTYGAFPSNVQHRLT